MGKFSEKKMFGQHSVYFSCNALCVVIYPPSQRKQQKDLLAALQKVVVPIYCTSFLAVEEEKQQKITRVNICTLKAQHQCGFGLKLPKDFVSMSIF